MKRPVLFLLLFTSLTPLRLAWSHGETRPGPHGGYVRMPGAFHTEVIPMPGGFKVLLLDAQLQNPSVAQSAVAGRLEAGNGESLRLACAQHTDHFFCALPQGQAGATGKLILEASRGGPAGRAIYALPLRFEEAPAANPHRHH